MRYVLIALLLAGCATPEQRAANAIARFGPYCEKLGYQTNTDSWRSCIQGEQSSLMRGGGGATVQPKRSTYCAPANGGATVCY